MATITHRPGQGNRKGWQVKIRRRGYPIQTATFDTKVKAEAWARRIESEMDDGRFISRTEAEATTLAEALERYAREVSLVKKSAQRGRSTIAMWRASPLGRRALASIRGKDIASVVQDKERDGLARIPSAYTSPSSPTPSTPLVPPGAWSPSPTLREESASQDP